MTRFTKIIIDKKEEAKFRRRALRKFPNEYLEMLWGFIENRCLHICAFVPIEHKAWINAVEYDEVDIDEHVERAKETKKLMLVGTIHTHPYREDATPSSFDFKDNEADIDLVMGVMSIEKKKKKGRKRVSQVAYWHPRALDPIYTDH